MSLRSWFWQRRRLDEDDLQAEIRAHLDIATEARIADGVDPNEARDASLREFGNVRRVQEDARGVWTPRWVAALNDLVSDVRYAGRSLATQRAFTLTVVLVLTLGIALNAAVFTMLKSLALAPLAGVDRSSQLAVVHGETSGGRALNLSYADYRHLRDHDTAFTGLAGTALATVGLGRERGARTVSAELVTGNYFQVLGTVAAQGRLLLPGDETAPGANPVVVLNHGLWDRDFERDPHLIGASLTINGTSFTVIGVAAPSFHGTTVVYDTDLFIPITMAPVLGYAFGSQRTDAAGVLADRRATVFAPLGFLRPGVTLADAAARTAGLWTELARERAVTPDGVARTRVVTFRENPGGAPSIVLPTLVVVAAMALLVLLIACANIAGLVLVRGLARRGEIAVRLALGATRRRIVRLLIVENLVLALPGAALGVVASGYGVALLAGYAEELAAPDRVFFNIEVDTLVIGFAVLVALLCALVFGFVPAVQCARLDLVSVLNQDASARGAIRGRFRTGLVVVQVAVSMLLLVGAGLVTRSLDAARRTHPGFEADRVASLELDVKHAGYDVARGAEFYRRVLDAAASDPAIRSATVAAFGPLAFLETPRRAVTIAGHTPEPDEDLRFLYNVVGPDYFTTLRLPLVAGRAFERRDDATAPAVAIVNQTLAERFWGEGTRALGQRLRLGDETWRTVIGVARDAKYIRVDETARPYVYVPFLQHYRSAMSVYALGQVPADELVQHVRGLVTTLDADVPILRATALADGLVGALLLFNLTAAMLFVFGSTGIVLVALGTYGVMAYTVRQSTREIGIRMALGAAPRRVLRDCLERGVRLGVAGVVLGAVATAGVTRLLGRVLFGVSATDPASYASAVAIVFGVVVVATLSPAWRASRTSPLQALRHP